VSTQEPLFHVRDIPIYGDAILSPMAGFSDVPYRALCRAHGSAMNYTEFVPAEALQGERNIMWRRLEAKPNEHPLVFQIFGNEAIQLLRAAQTIEELGPDIIDINMGCSTSKISGKGAGVAMMQQPALVAETFRLLTHHLSVPVTGKIRLGWDDTKRNYIEIAHVAEDNGASLIALHGRTKVQRYNFEADWDAIGELKQAMSVPVIGNGDVRRPEDIDAMKAHTGCDAVMIGRGAVGNPWIFSRKDREKLEFEKITETIRYHLQEMLAYYGDPHGLILFRKHLRRYISGRVPKPQQREMLEAENVDEFERLLQTVDVL
jgi:tRNA-dihydrouridine synthase B